MSFVLSTSASDASVVYSHEFCAASAADVSVVYFHGFVLSTSLLTCHWSAFMGFVLSTALTISVNAYALL